ncbi:DUF3048 domain-containing protein [Streptomyces thinghirensis]|nr:DUF3048 domain-containing protein [Streptomyces thinghirensis]
MAVSLAAGCTADLGAGGPAGTSAGAVAQCGRPGSVRRREGRQRAARPQTVLGRRDVVYAEPVEGGLSRLMAIYATERSRRWVRCAVPVSPTRSRRASSDTRPTLAFSGGRASCCRHRQRALRAEPPEGSDAYVRDDDRPAPHNSTCAPAGCCLRQRGADALATGFHYGEAPEGGLVGVLAHRALSVGASFAFTRVRER